MSVEEEKSGKAYIEEKEGEWFKIWQSIWRGHGWLLSRLSGSFFNLNLLEEIWTFEGTQFLKSTTAAMGNEMDRLVVGLCRYDLEDEGPVR